MPNRPLPALPASAAKIAKSFYIPVIKLLCFVFLCSILTDDGFRCLPLHLLVTKNPLLGIQLLVSQERVIYRGTILVRPLFWEPLSDRGNSLIPCIITYAHAVKSYLSVHPFSSGVSYVPVFTPAFSKRRISAEKIWSFFSVTTFLDIIDTLP